MQIFGEIYSVVNSVIAITLICVEGNKKININQTLIEEGLAIPKEENYLSRYNNDLRKKHTDMTVKQLRYYETMQYDNCNSCDDYPNSPEDSQCTSTVHLRGPFSPLESTLVHLPAAGRGKKVNVEMNSVNSILLHNNLEEQQEHLIVAGTVRQTVTGNNLTLHNTTLMPAIPGLTPLLALIFTPHMELRRNSCGTHYIGALCGLGYNTSTRCSLFPEHDMEIYFDVEITLDDLQDINRLRHWMSIGMHIGDQTEENDNSEEIMTCQNRIKIILSKLMDKCRKKRPREMMNNFDKWGKYNESLLLQPGRVAMVRNNIYNLHCALELEEKDDKLEEMINHVKELRNLAIEDELKGTNHDIHCKLCNVPIFGIQKLRGHLYTSTHKENENKLGIEI